MGILQDRATGRKHTLASRCLLGRNRACDICLDDPRVSGEHASVCWLGGRWELRDLGSRNGTFLHGRRLDVGERAPLGPGMVFSLGGLKAEFVLADASPPCVAARHRGTGALRVGSDGVLVLPDEARPLAMILEDDMGRWVAEIGEERRRVSDQEALEVGGEVWIVELPRPEALTYQSGGAGPVLGQAHFRFAVSRDEEEVQLTVQVGGQTMALPHRSHHYLLLTLARLRLADTESPEGERGWVTREDLCKMLAMDAPRINVDIHRARKQMAALGIADGADVVQRRGGTGELRLGVRSFEVVPL